MKEQILAQKQYPYYTIRWCEKMADIPQSAWNAMALPLKTPFFRVGMVTQLRNFG